MEQIEGGLFSHDPAIFYDDASGYYYTYSTDAGPKGRDCIGGHIRRSKDLIHFEFLGAALKDGKIPEEVLELTHARNIWAPDIIKEGNEYRLYYSASSFGSQNSVIGLAVSDSPEGPFVHRGIVVQTTFASPVNAIDANPVRDEETGEHYMVYGSFWGGIRLLKLDRATGLADEEGYGISLACRPRRSCDTAIEGPYIKYNPKTGYYYLFVSYDSLSNVYNVRVGRSKKLTGPYLDHNGVLMTDMEKPANHVGLKITTGYSFKEGTGFLGLGHNSVLRRGKDWYMVCHARYEKDPRVHTLNIRKMLWDDAGWPLVSPCLYDGETEGGLTMANLTGKYQRIDFVLDVKRLCEQPTLMRLDADGGCKIGDLHGRWNYDEARNDLEVVINGAIEHYRAIRSTDREEGGETIALTGRNDAGIGVWGKKIKE
ncbi:MAG: arabinan endo-1,5-alpha-L-arabinosidase [Lachnospiraceae bacterium]|nr:arabinan endo-1,5-alpha-L-arabinosidase [Lachnospiraceae bacterium]